jgi:nucleolar pre-ribosomal-associated protein 1
MPQDEDDKSAVYLENIMKTWSFASQSNNDSLLSAVPAVLALLLRTLSSMIDLTPYGLRLGRTLLQKRQLELLSRGLSSNKSKDYIISPSLRLIREVTSFDGGVLVKEVYRARDSTFKALARNIGLRHVGDDVEDPKKPSVRTHALRFLLTCIKFLPVKAKNELFTLRDVISGITRDISSDAPYLIAEILESLKVHVLQDEGLARDAKSKLLHPTNLGRIAALYGYNRDDDEAQQGRKSISSLAHEFLMLACTTPNMGVLYSKAGFYPRGVNPDESRELEDQNFIDLGLESLEWADKFTDKVPVRNTILSEFMQSLRPWSDIKQAELLLAIFEAAPELVADYFFGKKSFSFEPKLTATWIGYSAFLFSVIQLPVPLYFGHQDRYGRLPPPSSIVVESILPQPLTQKVLTRCLNQKSPLVTFFAIRLLIVAFQKLQDIIKQYHKAADTGSSIWISAEQQLTEMFCQRCPTIKDVIVAFNSISERSLMQRQAASELLVMYYEIIPQIALESKFDVATRLTETLRLMEDNGIASEECAMRVMELESLFEIAHFSPGMRWFNKPEPFHTSPFAAMLQLLAQASSEVPLLKIRSILDSVIRESGIMQIQTRLSSQDALIAALKACNGKGSSQAVYDFLDNCVLRCSATPVKYIDAFEQYYTTVYGEEQGENDSKGDPTSLLLLAIVEQWPFITKSSEMKTVNEIARFIANFMAASVKILEDKNIIEAIVKSLVSSCSEGSIARKVLERSRRLVDTLEIPEAPNSSAKSDDIPNDDPVEEQASADIELSMLQITDVDADDHSALTKWITKEVEEVIEEGHAAALIMLLSSPHLSARKEAMSNIAKLALKLKASSYDEREQVWLLLSELMETATPYISDQPLPTTITAFASYALAILRDPLHCLYPKINKFLSQGPTWQLDKFPLLHVILNEPPTLDDAHYSEVAFLLSYLTSGLQTAGDMAIFHKRHVFEKLLTFYNNPYLGKNLKEKILRALWRATAIEGGSTTLITRLSILSWLQAQMRLESGNRGLKALMERLLKTSDEEKLKAWSHRSVADFLRELE